MLDKIEIELEIVKYIADSDTPLIDINRLINFVLDKRVEYLNNNRAVPARDDIAVGKMDEGGRDHVVYTIGRLKK